MCLEATSLILLRFCMKGKFFKSDCSPLASGSTVDGVRISFAYVRSIYNIIVDYLPPGRLPTGTPLKLQDQDANPGRFCPVELVRSLLLGHPSLIFARKSRVSDFIFRYVL